MSNRSIFDEVFVKFPIDNYADFSKEMKLQWNRLKNQKYPMPKSSIFYSCDDLVKDNLKDRFSVYLGDVLFDFVMSEPKNEEDRKNLIVLFSASRNYDDAVPVFKRCSYMPFCPGYVLNVSDPMLSMYKQLERGWFYGNRNQAYAEYLAVVIDKIRNLLGIENRNVYFFGSSAGGYVSLHLSHYFDGTNHIAVNPQINLSDCPMVDRLEKLIKASVKDQDPFRRNETDAIIRENITKNKFLIAQNITDEKYCSGHLFPLLKKMDVTEIGYGLNQVHDNMLVWMYDVIGGNSAQGDRLFFSFIMYLAQCLSTDGYKVTDFEKFMVKNFSCVWRMRDWYKNVIDTK